VEIGNDRARVSLDCGDAAGLLVGRDGQTLAAVQYLAARIVGRKIGGALRLHIDAGHYRERQDDRLKELALSLAAKVKKTRKPQSTRPLSAYQRRIVHLALEPDPDVSTRSKGEGAQRRVVVYWAGSGN
jgi:spoIIIJ-associated protein